MQHVIVPGQREPLDGADAVTMDQLIANLKQFVPKLQKTTILPDCGHWAQKASLALWGGPVLLRGSPSEGRTWKIPKL